MTDQEEKILRRIHQSGNLSLDDLDEPEIKTAQGLENEGFIAFVDERIYLSREGRNYIEDKIVTDYPTHETRIAALESDNVAIRAELAATLLGKGADNGIL